MAYPKEKKRLHEMDKMLEEATDPQFERRKEHAGAYEGQDGIERDSKGRPAGPYKYGDEDEAKPAQKRKKKLGIF